MANEEALKVLRQGAASSGDWYTCKRHPLLWGQPIPKGCAGWSAWRERWMIAHGVKVGIRSVGHCPIGADEWPSSV